MNHRVTIKDWIQAMRLRTLPLSFSGIILGSFIARSEILNRGGYWDFTIFVLTILVALSYQILSNIANDYGDGVRGTDKFRNPNAEKRLVASGIISAKQMKKAILVMIIISFVLTILLVYKVFFPKYIKEFVIFLIMGLSSILAAITYTIGKKPYGYYGLGDIMVFVFFGLVSVVGSYFIFTKSFNWYILLPAFAIGMMSVAVLNLNNIRDINSDLLAGKKTLASILGFDKAMIYQVVLMQLPLMLILVFLMVKNEQYTRNYYDFIVMILLFPMAKLRRKIMSVKVAEDLEPFIKYVVLMTISMSILMAIGLNLGV